MRFLFKFISFFNFKIIKTWNDFFFTWFFFRNTNVSKQSWVWETLEMCLLRESREKNRTESVRQKWGWEREREREREIEEQIVCVCVCVWESNCVSVQLQHLVFHPVTPPPVLMSTFSLLGLFYGRLREKKTFWICKHHILSSFRSLSGAKLTPLVESLLRSGWSGCSNNRAGFW